MKPSKRFDHAYAILRFDEFLGTDVPIDHKVTVKQIVWDPELAQREVDRLNALQGGGGVFYIFRVTRVQKTCQEAAVTAPAAHSAETDKEAPVVVEKVIKIKPPLHHADNTSLPYRVNGASFPERHGVFGPVLVSSEG
jgi:hypothetical protein